MKKGILILTMFFIASNGFAASFTDNGDGTVTDSDTELMWQQGDDGIKRNWLDALSHCEGLSLAGYSDWKLPDIKELESITDDTKYSPAIDTTFFPNVPNADLQEYFSATTKIDDGAAFTVRFVVGLVTYENKGNSFYVRCVR